MPIKTQHPLYSVWRGMLRRCYTPTTRHYASYGGRGIAVCERWRGADGFTNFLVDMGPRPDGYSIDRIDNNSGYSPNNCRWSTRKEQQRNRRTTVYVTIEGCKYLAVELAAKAGLKTDTLVARVNRGQSFDEVTSPEKRKCKDGLTVGGIANGLRQQAKTHCPQGHSYADHAAHTPQGWRYCMVCKADKERARNARKRELKNA